MTNSTSTELDPHMVALAKRTATAFRSDGLITAESLLSAARTHGVTALGIRPIVGQPCKVLLGSLGIDVSNVDVQEQLLELNRTGQIDLTRVDAIGLIPADRKAMYDAGRFWSISCWFDCVSFDGALLGGVA